MSHNITERDAQVGLSQAWHGLTTVVKEIDPSDNMLRDWDVERHPLHYIDKDGNAITTGHGILRATDDGEVVGKPMSPYYKHVTNEMFMDLVSDAMKQLPKAKLESIGSVGNRGKVFATVSMADNKEYKVGDRTFQDYLNFGNSHDQTSRLWVNNTNICTVCENTFNFNLNNKNGMVGSAVHRGDVELKVADLGDLIKEFLGVQEDFKVKFQKLLKKKLKKENASRLFTGFLMRNNPREGLSTRCINTVEQLDTLFVKGAGNRGENYADAFSAVTDYYTHNSTRGGGKNKANQYYSSEHGLGRMNKSSFWTVINNEELAAKTIERGKKLQDLVNIA